MLYKNIHRSDEDDVRDSVRAGGFVRIEGCHHLSDALPSENFDTWERSWIIEIFWDLGGCWRWREKGFLEGFGFADIGCRYGRSINIGSLEGGDSSAGIVRRFVSNIFVGSIYLSSSDVFKPGGPVGFACIFYCCGKLLILCLVGFFGRVIYYSSVLVSKLAEFVLFLLEC